VIHLVLYQPQIPPNTGNVIRLCANTGAQLHLIEPLGFEPDDKKLRRAGLDYHDWAKVVLHPDFDHFVTQVAPGKVWVCETSGLVRYTDVAYAHGDAIVFGPETSGLSETFCAQFPDDQRILIPMLTSERSLNLSNCVAVVAYEAWRQLGFG
jgi:tRNA (cytidine/uridine-2'-O-)-methyltransferase